MIFPVHMGQTLQITYHKPLNESLRNKFNTICDTIVSTHVHRYMETLFYYILRNATMLWREVMKKKFQPILKMNAARVVAIPNVPKLFFLSFYNWKFLLSIYVNPLRATSSSRVTGLPFLILSIPKYNSIDEPIYLAVDRICYINIWT